MRRRSSAITWRTSRLAETGVHYLHIVDTPEMASESGIGVRAKVDRIGELAAMHGFRIACADFGAIASASVHLRRGQPRDRGVRPFILSPR